MIARISGLLISVASFLTSREVMKPSSSLAIIGTPRIYSAVSEVIHRMRSFPRRALFEDKGGSSAVVSILDSGPGIPAEKLNEVFDPFFITKQQEWKLACRSHAPSYRRTRDVSGRRINEKMVRCFVCRCRYRRGI